MGRSQVTSVSWCEPPCDYGLPSQCCPGTGFGEDVPPTTSEQCNSTAKSDSWQAGEQTCYLEEGGSAFRNVTYWLGPKQGML